MPTINVLNMEGNVVSQMDLAESIFGIKPNKVVMHTAVVTYLANQRQGTQSTLTRSEVSGGGKKPWRQKGTGNARQGSIRAPQWRHGGVALGPKPRDYRLSINKKVRRLAIKSALSSKVASEDFIVLDKIVFEEYKTKKMIEMLANLGVNQKTLIVISEPDNKVKKNADNIPEITTTLVNTINVYDLLNHDKIIMVKDAVDKIEQIYKD